ncbi:MAG: hypothetical protein JSS49_01930 [Planctomycetes bacterium]|nr:hypothetical protein [Planctomycetota bacterium]
MLDPTTESDDDIYLKKSGIDNSIGYLIAGVVVLVFFLVTVLGMGKIQSLSDEAGNKDRFAPTEKTAEIGDVEAAGMKD